MNKDDKKRTLLTRLAYICKDEEVDIYYTNDDCGIIITLNNEEVFSGFIDGDKNGAYKQFKDAAKAI